VTVLTRLRERYDTVAREAAKFGVVGALNTVLDFVVLNLLVFGLGVAPLRSKVAATVVAATSSYLMNRHWTFRHRERQQSVHREYVLFFVLNGVGLAISLTVLGGVRYGLDLEGVVALNLANLFAIGAGTLFRFWSYRRFVWLQPEGVEAAAEEGDTVAGVVVDLTAPAEPRGRAAG
jgi:putative flippase GtrA